jgi:hypothetical protein
MIAENDAVRMLENMLVLSGWSKSYDQFDAVAYTNSGRLILVYSGHHTDDMVGLLNSGSETIQWVTVKEFSIDLRDTIESNQAGLAEGGNERGYTIYIHDILHENYAEEEAFQSRRGVYGPNY